MRGELRNCGYTQSIQAVGILTKAKRHADFFVADGRQIRRQGWIEVSPVMIRPALDGDLEQPLGNTFARATELHDAVQQTGNMRNFAQLVGKRRCDGLAFQFHANIRNSISRWTKGINHR